MIRDEGIFRRDIAGYGYIDKVTALNFHCTSFYTASV